MSYKLDPPTFLRDLSRPAILLASPMGFPLGAWDRFTYLLLQAGFRIVRYDPPGVGNSDAPPDPTETTFRSLADDAARLLFHLGQLRLAMWVGVECKCKGQQCLKKGDTLQEVFFLLLHTTPFLTTHVILPPKEKTLLLLSEPINSWRKKKKKSDTLN
jgi:hypothetical protein